MFFFVPESYHFFQIICSFEPISTSHSPLVSKFFIVAPDGKPMKCYERVGLRFAWRRHDLYKDMAGEEEFLALAWGDPCYSRTGIHLTRLKECISNLINHIIISLFRNERGCDNILSISATYANTSYLYALYSKGIFRYAQWYSPQYQSEISQTIQKVTRRKAAKSTSVVV